MIDVVSDASVVLKWFRDEGETEVAESRALVDRYGQGEIGLFVLDLTAYEIGNALVRGRRASAAAVRVVLDGLAAICPQVRPTPEELRLAATLAETHGLTFYDAAYAAVARSRGAELATLDRALLDAGLGLRPSEILAKPGA